MDFSIPSPKKGGVGKKKKKGVGLGFRV